MGSSSTMQAFGPDLEVLKGLVETLPDAVFVKDTGGHYLLVNDAAVRSLGLDCTDVVGHTDAESFTPELASSFVQSDH